MLKEIDYRSAAVRGARFAEIIIPMLQEAQIYICYMLAAAGGIRNAEGRG